MPAERRVIAGDIGTRYWETEGPGHPVLFVHGNPTSADDWLPFLSTLEGERRCLAPDLVGWGKSERPADLKYTMDTLAWFLERFIDALAVKRFDLVVHDWGAIGLVVASWRPKYVGRVVIMNAVPLTSDYRWHWVARLWRRRVVGELLQATLTRWGTRQLLRQATVNPDVRAELADHIMRYMDRRTKRAILQLYRDADPDRLGYAGRQLGGLQGPGLVVWGDDDPYLPTSVADLYGQALGGETRVEHLSGAGHWPWLDRPEVVDLVSDFLKEGTRGRKRRRPPQPRAGESS
jgi:pimeloyl-ACP methyl ester carboxylesterase